MLKPSFTRQFQRDLKVMKKRGKSLQKFKEVATILISGQLLVERYRNHKLSGKYVDRYECHIEPDWLLIYKLTSDSIIFERMGTHADLFR